DSVLIVGGIMKAVWIIIAAIFGVLYAFGFNSSVKSTRVKVDGSSTVFPITEAVAEDFGRTQPRIRIVVGSSGTGGGFKKFIKGEIDINNASRAIKPIEAKQALAHGVPFIALPVALDGISIVVNKENDWVDSLTSEELKKIWQP